MEGARPATPRDELELLELGEQPEEQRPLNGELRVLPSSAEDPCPPQANKKNCWSSCNTTVIGRCKLWMVIGSIFLGFIAVVTIGLCLTGVMYIDEDENEIIELSSNKTFFIMLRIPEECIAEEELPHLLAKRACKDVGFTGQLQHCQITPEAMICGILNTELPSTIKEMGINKEKLRQLTDVYSMSPSLSRYFMSVEIVDFSDENSTATYHLQFGVPLEDHGFMKYMMSEELVLGILLQDFHDQSESGCEGLGLDPDSLLLYE